MAQPWTWGEASNRSSGWRPVAWFQFLGSWWFFLWRENPGLRFFIEVFGVATFVMGISAFTLDYFAKKEERLARMWAIATDPRPGNSGKIPALEFLKKNGHALTGIEIPHAYLQGVKLNGARLERANLKAADLQGSAFLGATLKDAVLADAILIFSDFSRANLDGAKLIGTVAALAHFRRASLWQADLSGADLSGSDFRSADFREAIFTDTVFSETDVTGSNMSNSIGLAQKQVDTMCQLRGGAGPILPNRLTWHGRVCRRYKR